MRSIDLGDSSDYQVKFEGEVYSLKEPRIRDAKSFQKAQKKAKDGDEMEPFIDFLVNLGLPKEVAESIPLKKVKILTDAIMGDLEKK